jgi:hypothetical protein
MRTAKFGLAALVGLAIVVGGCTSAGAASQSASSTAVTPTPTPTPTATPNPDALFDRAIAAGPSWQAFHLKVSLSGSIAASLLRAIGDPEEAGLKSDVSVDGTTIEGDMDPVHLACNLNLSIPATSVTGAAITGNLIIIDPTAYLKLSSGGAKYYEFKLGKFSSQMGLKVAVPTPGGSSLVGIADDVSNLRKALEATGVKPTLLGIDQIGGKDAYHIDLTVPLTKINADIAAAAASAQASFLNETKIESATAAVWIYKDGLQLAKVQIAGAASDGGNLSFTATLSDFGRPVTITPPAASDISAGN